MQIFDTMSFIKKDSVIIITDPRVIYQIKRVLRYRIGQHIIVQQQQDGYCTRFHCMLTVVADSVVECEVQQEHTHTHTSAKKTCIIAMPNKRDKLELIAQKTTECGITHIIVVPTKRSVIKHKNDHKRNRISSIVLEAVEQSGRYEIPVIQRTNSLKDINYNNQILLCHMGGEFIGSIAKHEDVSVLIGPEGGRDISELEWFSTNVLSIQTISLGGPVLRMETAAIIASWNICN